MRNVFTNPLQYSFVFKTHLYKHSDGNSSVKSSRSSRLQKAQVEKKWSVWPHGLSTRETLYTRPCVCASLFPVVRCAINQGHMVFISP